jgi:predicted phage terminase large subunit-like protein
VTRFCANITMTQKIIKPSFEARRSSELSVRERADTLRYQRSLGDFTEAAWRHAGEPQAYQSNWHIDCLCDHLMAVARRELKGPGPLIFTMPPRHMKSRGVNVFFPAWVWAQDPDPNQEGHGLQVRPGTLLGPGVKFAYVSYLQDLANEHSGACRQLISSEWYCRRWGSHYRLVRNHVEHLVNSAGGSRFATSFSGVTGFGADIIVVDDAHDIHKAESKAAREATLHTWDEVLQTRLNDPKTGMFIVIMQRSHERDLIGHILSREFNGMHVCLPAQYEANHPYVFAKAKPGWEVKRQTDSSNGRDGGPSLGEPWRDFRKEGDPLWPKRIDEVELKRMAVAMGNHAAAGQLQQRPTAREGGVFKFSWFENKARCIPPDLDLVRAWDFAGSPEGKYDADYTAGVLMGRHPITSVLYVLDIVRGRFSPAELERRVRNTAILDGYETRIRIPEDPGGAGKFQACRFVELLQGYSVRTERESGLGSKERRADPFAAQCEHGLVKLVEGPWNKAFIDELCAFPHAAHDDQVDAASAAFRQLTTPSITYYAIAA